MFQRIMVLCDLTDTTQLAWRPLDQLTTGDNRIVLYHAASGASERYYLPDETRAAIDVATRRRVQRDVNAVAEVMTKRGMNVEPVVDIGTVYDNLFAALERYDVDLLVVPTGVHHSLTRGISNSVTARAIRSRKVPLLIINERFADFAKDWVGFERVLCPIDFGPRHRHGLAVAASVARVLGADLSLLHVVRSLELDDFINDLPHELGRAFNQTDVVDAAAKRLDQLCSSLHSDLHADTAAIEADNVGAGICAHAERTGAGAIVLPGVGADQTRTLLLGSVAEYVIKHAPVPVFICDAPISA